jgi:hypothetical protein
MEDSSGGYIDSDQCRNAAARVVSCGPRSTRLILPLTAFTIHLNPASYVDVGHVRP